MKLEKGNIIKPFCADTVTRPWGYYGLYADNIKSTTKILYIKKGELLSLQYHFRRDQQYVMLDGDFLIDYSDKQVPLSIINDKNEDRRIKNFEKFLNKNMISTKACEGDIFCFHRRVIHRATYNGNREYGRFLDIAFGTNMEEGDIIRIEDKYGRADITSLKI